MILIAPDKYKGTLSALAAAEAMAAACPSACLLMPMADGGEGTAAAIGRARGWEERDGYFFCPASGTAAIDSNAFIGQRQPSLLQASSAPLGAKVRQMLEADGCRKVLIGVGGTATCDAGVGFLHALGIDRLHQYAARIVGLCDVAVPLLPSSSPTPPPSVAQMLTTPSALTFAAQKGAKPEDYPVLWRRLAAAQAQFARPATDNPYAGAGGGLGFAIGSAIGAQCVSGAEYVWRLLSSELDWSHISLVITGEGKIDEQTPCGKAVAVVAREAHAHGKPCIAVGGTVATPLPKMPCVCLAADAFLPSSPLSPAVAAERITQCLSNYFSSNITGA